MRKRKPKPFCLPSDYKALNGYLHTHKKELFDHVIDCLEYGITHITDVTVFAFQNSKYTISISPDDFGQNIDHLYTLFLDNECYELCSKISKTKEEYATKKFS